MDPSAQFEKNVRGFYTWLGAMACAAAAPFVAQQLLDVNTPPARIAAVVLGAVGWVPIILVTANIIRNGDEFVRRINLIAIAIAFACGLTFISLVDWLTRARFVDWVPLSVIWVGVAVLWGCAVIGVNLYYGRAR